MEGKTRLMISLVNFQRGNPLDQSRSVPALWLTIKEPKLENPDLHAISISIRVGCLCLLKYPTYKYTQDKEAGLHCTVKCQM